MSEITLTVETLRDVKILVSSIWLSRVWWWTYVIVLTDVTVLCTWIKLNFELQFYWAIGIESILGDTCAISCSSLWGVVDFIFGSWLYWQIFLWLLAVVALQTAGQIVPHNMPHLIPSTPFKLIIHCKPVGQLTPLRRDHNNSETVEKIFEPVDNI
jgi:hypothetical protein